MCFCIHMELLQKFQLSEVQIIKILIPVCMHLFFRILQVLKVWQQIRFLTRSWLLGQCDPKASSTVPDGTRRNLSSGRIGQPTDNRFNMCLCSISICHLACTESNTTIIPRFVVFYDIISAEFMLNVDLWIKFWEVVQSLPGQYWVTGIIICLHTIWVSIMRSSQF